MQSTLPDEEYWRNRASEVRAQAEQMSNPEAKRQMLKIAEKYEHLARENRHPPHVTPSAY